MPSPEEHGEQKFDFATRKVRQRARLRCNPRVGWHGWPVRHLASSRPVQAEQQRRLDEAMQEDTDPSETAKRKEECRRGAVDVVLGLLALLQLLFAPLLLALAPAEWEGRGLAACATLMCWCPSLPTPAPPRRPTVFCAALPPASGMHIRDSLIVLGNEVSRGVVLLVVFPARAWRWRLGPPAACAASAPGGARQCAATRGRAPSPWP